MKSLSVYNHHSAMKKGHRDMEYVVGSLTVGAILVTRHIVRTRIIHHGKQPLGSKQVEDYRRRV